VSLEIDTADSSILRFYTAIFAEAGFITAQEKVTEWHLESVHACHSIFTFDVARIQEVFITMGIPSFWGVPELRCCKCTAYQCA